MSTEGRDAIFIVGPTAVGKSDVALLLAGELGGEIIAVDSMQVYRGMDIGTAKPSHDERGRIPHHLLDIVPLSENFDAARFCELASRAEASIRSRRRVPIFCGGTGLYLKAYLYGLGRAPAPDAALRAELESTPASELLRELNERDPQSYQSIDRNNPRRLIRALEIIRLTGAPLSSQRADWSVGRRPTALFALSREPGDLRRRIEVRVDGMFERGLVDEVKRLLNEGLAQNRTALQALGYRQVVEHLQGQRSLEETHELVKIRTWQFARRQMNWLRRQLRPDWIHIPPNEPPHHTATRIGVTSLLSTNGSPLH